MRLDEDSAFNLEEIDQWQVHMPHLVRAGLTRVLAERRAGFSAANAIIEDISSQIFVELLEGEMRTLQEIRTRIRTLCFEEVNHMKQNLTGQDFVDEEGKVALFEGHREGVNDLRDLEDACDEQCGPDMAFDPAALLESKYLAEDGRAQRIREQYEYFAGELCAVYRSLDSDFLKRFFVEWLVCGRDPYDLSRMIRIPEEEREHVSILRVAQCRGLIVERVRQMSDLDVKEIEVLLDCAPVVFRKLSEFGGKNPREVFGELNSAARGFAKFERIDVAQILELARSGRGTLYVEDFFPELLPADVAKKRQIEAVMKLESGLAAFARDPKSFCVGRPQKLYAHQRKKLKEIAEYLVAAIGSDNQIFLADIAPPSAGKTYMQAVLAKLTGLPFVFVTPSNAILTGPDGALATFEKLFPRSDLGLVNHQHKEFGRLGTLVTYANFTMADTLRQIMMRETADIPLLFLLDEGDLAQTDLRRSAIGAIQHALHHPIVCAFSATTTVRGRHLGGIADIVDEMSLVDLIKRGRSKHVLGFYVDARVAVGNENIVKRDEEKKVDFETLKNEGQEAFVAVPLRVVQENHLGEKGIVHCMSVRHAELTAKRLAENGINAVCVSGRGPREQKMTIQRYMEGDVDVLTSCDYLARGWSDHGVTQFVVFADVTSSNAALYHKVGRGFRPHPANKVLSIYQMLPMDIRATRFVPALLKDIFPVDNTIPVDSGGGFKDMRSRLMELIEEGGIEFIGAIGAQPEAASGVCYITQIQVEKVIDTLEDLQDDSLVLDAGNIDELFKPVVDALIAALGGGIGAINTGKRFSTQSVAVHDKKITGRHFARNILHFLAGVPNKEAWQYLSAAIVLIKEWYLSGERPSASRAAELLVAEHEKRESRLHLDESNIDELFGPIMDEIIRAAGKDAGDVSWISQRRFYPLPAIEIQGGKVTPNAFFHMALAVLFEMTQLEVSKYRRCGCGLLQEWYRTGQRPDRERVAEALRLEQTERVHRLNLTEDNLDEYFLPVMDVLRKAVKGEPGALDWIKINRIADIEAEVDGCGITEMRFIVTVCSVLCGIPPREAQGIQGVAIEIVREWYRIGARPSRKWCVKLKEERAVQASNKLKIESDNIDVLFRPVMNSLIAAAGYPAGDCNWMNYMRLQGVNGTVDGKTINGQTFCHRVFVLLTGLSYVESSKYKGLTNELMRQWYQTGRRPDEETIAQMLAAPRRTRYMRREK